jgi:hypothetical protein
MKLFGKGVADRSKLAKKTRAPYLWELGLGGHAQDAPGAHRPGGHGEVRQAAACHAQVTDAQIGSLTQCVHPLVHREKDQDEDLKSPSIVKPDAPKDAEDSDFDDDCRFHWCVPEGPKQVAETVSKKRRRRRLKLKTSRRSVAPAQP